ncbi:putative 28S rRNA (cytosine-C(5))-methyltransferase [Boothiomyces macroporosus]|uniref:28S rRNA (Cytosine-C(5))-methyltransferase n=1 Tax=Boothiomyces macroporosus TaxID=261099 RepID=A0AAD5UMR1_9FUNG|nr:putative 28S rRNA (cytosine-C(5))-methyltransferase [Boothiomyces macroporosus]
MGNSFYDVAAKIIQKLSGQKGTIKSLVMAEKTTDKKLLYAIICETLKYRQVIEEIMEKSGILKQEKKMGKYLLTVLIYDLLFGKGRISGVYKEKILRHKTRLNAELVKIKIKRGCKDNKDLIPEHIRNAIVLPRQNQMCKDDHLPELLILPPSADLHDDELLLDGAAPGNKTSHLSAIMKNTGKITAFDMDRKRLDTLERLTGRAGCSNIKAVHGSFLDANPKDYSNIEYILLDPSCSGSGIVGRMDHLVQDFEENEAEDTQERVNSLAEFQKQVLLHAFSFPKVKRVVYSTCSKHKEENEMVVEHVLSKNKRFKLVENVFSTWKRRGLEEQ